MPMENPFANVKKKQACYLFFFLFCTAIAFASCFVNEAPRNGLEDAPSNPADVAWMLIATALVLLMTPGLAFFYGGMVGSRNVISTMLQNIIAMGLISVIWVIFGFSLAFGEDAGHFYGSVSTFWMFKGVGGATDPNLAPTIPLALGALFQMKFAIITPALITGSFAERVRFPGYLTYIFFWHIVVYCPLAHWTWHPEGFLRKWGVLDFAGGTVVHMSSGCAALAGAIILGRRKAHVEKEKHVAANVPFVILGTGLLWFGWFGFNAGSALAANELAVLAFLTTNTAAAMAMITWLFLEGAQGRKLSASGACIGAVVGLVSITPACGFVSVQRAIFIGFIGACISNVACTIKSKTNLDDTLDVFPCHGVGGMTGMICTGFFANDVGVVAGYGKTFGYHWLALVIVAGYSFVVSFVLYWLLDKIIPMRVDPWKEEQGLDVTQHGESLYTYDLDNTVHSQSSASGMNPSGGFNRRTSLLPYKDLEASFGVGAVQATGVAAGTAAAPATGPAVTINAPAPQTNTGSTAYAPPAVPLESQLPSLPSDPIGNIGPHVTPAATPQAGATISI